MERSSRAKGRKGFSLGLGILLEELVEQLGGLHDVVLAVVVGRVEIGCSDLGVALGILGDVLLEQGRGFFVVTEIEVGTTEHVQADVVILASLWLELVDHLAGTLDALLVALLGEEAGEHQALDRGGVLGVGELGEELLRVRQGVGATVHHEGGAGHVEEVVLTLFGVGEVVLELAVGGVGAADITFLLVQEGEGGELDDFHRLVVVHLGLEAIDALPPSARGHRWHR